MKAGACLSPDELAAFLCAEPEGHAEAGRATVEGGLRARIEAHAVGCEACRVQLAALALLGPESAEESAALERHLLPPEVGGAAGLLHGAALRAGPDSALPAGRSPESALVARPARPPEPGSGEPELGHQPHRSWPRHDAPAGGTPRLSTESAAADARERRVRRQAPTRRSRALRLTTAAGFAAAAAVALVVALRPPPPLEDDLAPLQTDGRPLEGALSMLRPAPYQPRRGAPPESSLDRPLRRLLEAHEQGRPGAARALATFYLVRNGLGDPARAEELLRRGPVEPDGLNDLAVLLYARGDLTGALDACLRALEGEPRHRAARFNRALVLARLGLSGQAAEAFEEIAAEGPGSPWAPESRDRAAKLRRADAEVGKSKSEDPGPERLAALGELFAANTPAAVARARARIARLPSGLASDLSRLGALVATRTPAQLQAHGALFARYRAVKAAVVGGTSSEAELPGLVTASRQDALLEVPSLLLAAYRHQVRFESRAAQALQLEALEICRARGCAVESEAIALDELAEAAWRDGDFAQARKLRDRAEALFASVAADLQLGELQRKRALMLRVQGSLEEAAVAAALALRTLTPGPERTVPEVARAVALNVAGSVALGRGQARAAAALHRAGLWLLREQPASDAAIDLAQELLHDEVALHAPAEALPVLRAELERQAAAGHKGGVLALRVQLAEAAAQAGYPRTALAEAQQGLAAAAATDGRLTSDSHVAALRVTKARALLAEAGATGPADVRARVLAAEARAELLTAVAEVEKAVRTSDYAAALGLVAAGRDAALELAVLGAREGRPAADLLGPLDRLRAAALRVPAVIPAEQPGRWQPQARSWQESLPPGACLLALLPREKVLLRLALTAGAGEARELPVGREALQAQVGAVQAARAQSGSGAPSLHAGAAEEQLAASLFTDLPLACSAATALWLLAEGPLERLDLTALPLRGKRLAEQTAAGVVSSLSRLLAPEPTWPAGAPGSTLLVHGAAATDALLPALPAADRERTALRGALGRGALLELTGPPARPEALLERLEATGLVHLAVHGHAGARDEGGYLQLSGQPSRLSVPEIAAARLPAGARVVLAACGAAGADSGLAWAFARAGAAAVAAAEGEVDDEAAARWAERFYPALARGLSLAEANREALLSAPPNEKRAWFVVLK